MSQDQYAAKEKKGKQLFNALYFPIKRIEYKNEFELIYQQTQECNQSIKSAIRKGFIVSYTPVSLYIMNYLLFFEFSNVLHFAAIGVLGFFGLKFHLRSLLQTSQMAHQFYINERGNEFIITIKNSIFFNKYDEKIINNDKKDNLISIKFKLDDIVDITLLKQYIEQQRQEQITQLKDEEEKQDSQKGHQTKKDEKQYMNKQTQEKQQQILKEKDEEHKNINNKSNDDTNKNYRQENYIKNKLNEQKSEDNQKNITEFVIEPEDNKDVALITIQKQTQQAPIMFAIDISHNQLNFYNDYIIALAKKHRIVNKKLFLEETIKLNKN